MHILSQPPPRFLLSVIQLTNDFHEKEGGENEKIDGWGKGQKKQLNSAEKHVKNGVFLECGMH